MKKITMQDVAEKAGVSKSTISQYINNRYEYMAESTKVRIEEAIRELGYIPNFIAKSLKQKKTSTIGVIVANILNTFSTEIIRAIEDVCEKNNIHMFVCNADDNYEKERGYIDMLLAKQVDGLIIAPNEKNLSVYKKLKNANFPVVFIDRKLDEDLYPTLLLDNGKAAEMAVNKLIGKDRRKIGLVSLSIQEKVTPRIERIHGFQKTMQKHGLESNEYWMITEKRDNILLSLEKLWEENYRPDAFFATNDLSLIELLKFIRKKQLQIPKDVSVIAVDDSDFLEISVCPITAIKQPTFDMGRDAASMLLNLIEQHQLEESYDIKRYAPVFVERESL